jgi:hypothetical protein
MAKFLTTVANSYNIEEIIKKSKKQLTLVTPYLKLSTNILERILDANGRGVKISLIYGKNELSKSERTKLNLLSNIEVFFLENLHAKCYHNENTMIISSMNLYEFSERNNREMGILIDYVQDEDIFKDTLDEIKSIKNASIRKKQFSKSKVETSILKVQIKEFIKLYPDLKKVDIMHYEYLLATFYSKYSNYKIEPNKNGLLIHNFPVKGIFLEAGYSISFNVPNEEQYFLFKRNHREKIRKELKGFRIFNNYLKTQVYPAKNFEPGDHEAGIKIRVNKNMEVINTFHKYWSE